MYVVCRLMRLVVPLMYVCCLLFDDCCLLFVVCCSFVVRSLLLCCGVLWPVVFCCVLLAVGKFRLLFVV